MRELSVVKNHANLFSTFCFVTVHAGTYLLCLCARKSPNISYKVTNRFFVMQHYISGIGFVNPSANLLLKSILLFPTILLI